MNEQDEIGQDVPPIDPTCPVRVLLKPGDHYGSLWLWIGSRWELFMTGAERRRLFDAERMLQRAFSAAMNPRPKP